LLPFLFCLSFGNDRAIELSNHIQCEAPVTFLRIPKGDAVVGNASLARPHNQRLAFVFLSYDDSGTANGNRSIGTVAAVMRDPQNETMDQPKRRDGNRRFRVCEFSN